MTNKEITRALRLTASLGELHGENEFKLKSLVNGAFQVDRAGFPLEGKSLGEILAIPGIGKGIAHKIVELLETGTTAELQQLLSITPPGILELLAIKGIGPKKVAALWHELGIESPGELLYACNENRLLELKGFGEKTQKTITEALRYNLSSKGRLHYQDARMLADALMKRLQELCPDLQMVVVGELRRHMETCDEVAILLNMSRDEFLEMIPAISELEPEQDEGNEYRFRFAGKYLVRLILSDEAQIARMAMELTGPLSHLNEIGFSGPGSFQTEQDFYKAKGLPYILPELRDLPLAEARIAVQEQLVDERDIRGCIHAHSTWSDGADTIRTMAQACISLGYEYLVISDHSRSAGYAGGLSIERIRQQHEEIDELNVELAPFKIFKGIESDILVDGSLDYPDAVLQTFDLVIASVHSVLRMDEEKATARIIRALENPYTTMLGHPSGRLLLSRQAYPLDYQAIIETAARHQVVIELNANRFRMDIDWRHIPLCLKHQVMISVNPDAHQQETIPEMKFGIDIARKGGLPKTALFNGLSRTQLENWLSARSAR